MVRLASLGLLCIAAIAVRLHGIDQSIVRFHPTRHYRSAVLAHACYVDHVASEPWAVAVAHANREMQPAGELPVMEWLACGSYRLLGREVVAVPRALAALIWVSGMIPLWFLAVRIASPSSAMIAVALYLFLPYGIVASRNFQPDPLMTVASLWALVGVFRYRENSTLSRLVAAALMIGVAGLIKPMSVFLTVPAVFALAPDLGATSLLVAGGLALPSLYYGYSSIAGSLVRDQMHMRFVPSLLGTAFFWNGLATQASRVMTLPLLAGAAIGAMTASTRPARRLLMALFAGYALFAIGFTYHMATHDYYHLPYIALVALGMAVLFTSVERVMPPSAGPGLAVALSIAVALSGGIAVWPRLAEPDDANGLAEMYQEIGSLTAHDTKAIFLDTEYGYALMYHAQISGDSWPNLDDLAAEKMDGRAVVDADARFERDYAAFGPHYFIATDLRSLDAEPDLQAMLARRTTAVRVTDRFRVYRFRDTR